MKPKHTPGPWVATPSVKGSDHVDVWTEEGIGHVAAVSTGLTPDPSAIANARLIAAAPELLRHLIDTLPVIDDAELAARGKARQAIGSPRPEFEDKWNYVADRFAEQANDIRTAIAKATGQTP